MILYFADRQLNIIGQASTSLPNGLTVYDDLKKEDIESGVASFECRIPYDKKTRNDVEKFAAVGNYILRSNGDENEFYTIIESEGNTRDKEVYVYAEDAGLDLLNEIVGDFEATEAKPIAWYVEQFAYDSGFEIGVNEASTLTRKLSWEGEETVTSRLASLATQFDGCEISYSFKVDGLIITNKYINIHKERGKDTGAQLRLNKEVDRIVSKNSIANLATALICTGGMSNQSNTILEKTSNGVAYTVELKTVSRTANSVKLKANISAALTSESAELSDKYGLKASIYVGGSWHSVVIKATDKDHKQKWSGTTGHSTDFTFDISGINPGVVTFTRIQFKVERTDSVGGSQGILSATNCNNYSIPNYIKGGENGEDIENRPITLEGYVYNDGDFFIDGTTLKSKSAVQRWGRYVWNKEPNKLTNGEGHITKMFEYDTFDQEELLTRAIEELKKVREIEVNYEVDINKLPEGTKIGDRINIIDDDIGLYFSARILMLETSVANKEQTATIGEYLIKNDGIAQEVYELASKFAELSVTATRAKKIATDAKKVAETANTQAQTAQQSAQEAGTKAEEAKTASDAALLSAQNAEDKATEAQEAVDGVQASVAVIEQTVANAEVVAEQARQAAETAEQKATEAHTASVNAGQQAQTAEQKATEAQEKADEATEKATQAQTKAEEATTKATEASTTALAAKQDAQKAQEEIDALGDNLTTLEETMQADYSRKTDLTEAEAHLQAQITKNAAEIASNVSKIQIIDETANDATEKAEQAQTAAQQAQAEAEQAQAEATAAQTKADEAKTAAQNAQNEADTAKQAAATAQGVADKAKADLEAAQEDLATVQGRVDATEADILAAQQKVNEAQAAADKAQTDADTATQKATEAQENANKAVTDAENAQTVANEASGKANIAQQVANEAKGSAEAAQTAATEAKETAQQAQTIANQAKQNATNAQQVADQAKADAEAAQTAADNADAKAQQAQTDLDTAKQNLANVTLRVDATEEEVAKAQEDVIKAQEAADKAKADAVTAQQTADTAKANAQTAQTAADNAQTKAEEAQQAADEAKDAADKAQEDVDALAIRVTSAETSIKQTNEQIGLMATKTEVVLTPKVSGQYTNTVVIENALEDSIEARLFGKSWQDGTATPDTPQEIHSHGESGSLVLSLFSSNLIDWYGNLKAEINGVKTSIQSDGGIKVVGTNTVGYSQIVRTTKILPAGTYYVSGGVHEVNKVYVQVSFPNAETGGNVYNINQSFTLTQPTTITVSILTHGTTGQAIDTVIYPMLNVGTEQAEFSPYVNEQTLSLQTPNGLHGLKVSSGGNYTDANGQQWLCDEIDLERGKYVQRVAKTLITNCEYFDATNKIAYGNLVYYPERGKSFFGSMSNKLVEDINFWTNRTVGTYVMRTTSTADWQDYMRALIFVPSEITSKAEATAWFLEQEIYILHHLYEPIETDLTDEEIATIKDTKNKAGTVTIIADANMYVKASGIASSKSAEDIKSELESNTEVLRGEITEQTTQAILEADRMLWTALESYVKNDDYGTFKETTQMMLEALSEKLTLSFTQATEATNAVNEDLQAKYNEITTFFTFDINGLIIGKTDNPYKMVLSNERYSMMVNETEVMYIDAVTKMAHFPKLTITEVFVLLGYQFEKGDVEGLVNVDWIGGV